LIDGDITDRVFSLDSAVSKLECNGFVVEDASVGEHPVAKEKVEDGSVLEDGDCVFCQFVVEGGGLLVEVGNEESFGRVEDGERDCGNEEEDGDTKAVEHADESDVEDDCVLEMDKVLRARVKIDIELD